MLNKTICPCGKELKAQKFDKYTPMKLNDRFYGGRVAMTGEIKCECGRELRGYFQKITNTPELIDLEVVNEVVNEVDEAATIVVEETVENEPTIDTIEEEKTDLKPISCVDFSEMSYKELQKYAKAHGVEKVNITRDELIEKLK